MPSHIPDVPKVRKNSIFFSFYLIDRRLGLIFIPHILGDTSERCGIGSASGRSNLFQSI